MDKTGNRVAGEDTAMVLQEGGAAGAPIRVEVEKKMEASHSGGG